MERVQLSSADHVVLLAGSQALPNYLAAVVLRPSRCSLLYSRETEKSMEALRDVLAREPFAPRCVPELIDDPWRAKSIAEVVGRIAPPYDLVYTGGTKVMAAQALRGSAGQGRAWYLMSEPSLCLVPERGDPIELPTVHVPLETMLELHGIEPRGSGSRQSGDEAGWLADTTEGVCAADGRAPSLRVRQNLGRKSGADLPGAAILLTLEHRLYLIDWLNQAGADNWTMLVKLRLFKAMLLARQLGGDHARAAVVSHAPSGSLERAQGEVEPVWEEGMAPKAFGEEDLKAWQAGRLEALRAWLRLRQG